MLENLVKTGTDYKRITQFPPGTARIQSVRSADKAATMLSYGILGNTTAPVLAEEFSVGYFKEEA